MADPMTLVEFLRARLAEDERKAMQVYRVDWNDPDGWAALHALVREHAQHHDPARVLRDVEAKRRIVERHDRDPQWADSPSMRDGCKGCGYEGPMESPRFDVDECPELRDLASVYADHPDYKERWRP